MPIFQTISDDQALGEVAATPANDEELPDLDNEFDYRSSSDKANSRSINDNENDNDDYSDDGDGAASSSESLQLGSHLERGEFHLHSRDNPSPNWKRE